MNNNFFEKIVSFFENNNILKLNSSTGNIPLSENSADIEDEAFIDSIAYTCPGNSCPESSLK